MLNKFNKWFHLGIANIIKNSLEANDHSFVDSFVLQEIAFRVSVVNLIWIGKAFDIAGCLVHYCCKSMHFLICENIYR